MTLTCKNSKKIALNSREVGVLDQSKAALCRLGRRSPILNHGDHESSIIILGGTVSYMKIEFYYIVVIVVVVVVVAKQIIIESY